MTQLYSLFSFRVTSSKTGLIVCSRSPRSSFDSRSGPLMAILFASPCSVIMSLQRSYTDSEAQSQVSWFWRALLIISCGFSNSLEPAPPPASAFLRRSYHLPVPTCPWFRRVGLDMARVLPKVHTNSFFHCYLAATYDWRREWSRKWVVSK